MRLERFADWSLRTKIVVLLVAASAAPLILAVTLSASQIQRREQDAAVALLRARADELAGQLGAFHTFYLRAASRIGLNPVVGRACSRDADRAAQLEARAALDSYLATDAAILRVEALRLDHQVAVTEPPGLPQGETDPDALESALRGRTSVSRLHLVDSASGRAEAVIDYLAPVTTPGGQPVGTAVLTVRASAFWEVVRAGNERAGPGSYSVILDQDGIRIAHSFNTSELFRPAGPLAPELVERSVAWRRFGSTTRQLLTSPNAMPQEFELATDLDARLAATFTGYAPANDQVNLGVGKRISVTGWTLFYLVPEATIRAPAVRLAARTAAVGIVLAGLAFGAGLLLSRGILRPVRALAAAADRIAQGEHVHLESGGADELGRLTDHVNKMSSALAAGKGAVETQLRERSAAEQREREARDQAEHAHALLRETIERVTDGFIALDREWRYTYVNRTAGALFGREPSQLLGRHIWSEFPEGIGQPFHLAYERAIREQSPITFQDHYAPWDRWFENRVYPSERGLTVYFSETTEKVRLERLRAEAESRLRAAVELAEIGLWTFEVATARVDASPRMCQFAGFAPDQCPASLDAWADRVHPDDIASLTARVQAGLMPGPPGESMSVRIAFRYRHPDGAVRWIEEYARTLRGPEGKTVRILAAALDVTERVRERNNLRALATRLQSIREEEKSRIARDLHDDLGQMLTGLKMDLRWLERRLTEPQPGGDEGVVDRIVGASALVDTMVGSVRRIAADLRPGTLDQLGLGPTLEGEARRFEARSGIRTIVRVDGKLPALRADAALGFYRVAQEALTNVARHSGASDVAISLDAGDGNVVLRVEDNGQGFDPASPSPRGLGIIGMVERMAGLGGEVTIEPGRSSGTVVKASARLAQIANPTGGPA